MRLLLASLVFALAAALSCWLGLQAVDASMEGRPPQIGLDAWAHPLIGIGRRIDALVADPGRDPGARVVFLGDSTTIIPIAATIPISLERALRARTPRSRSVKVESLAFSGMNPFDYYYLSEPVRRTRPGRIVMNLNLAAFSELFRAYESRPELAGWVSPGRWFQAAALPLHYQGLTFDQLLLRSAIVELGAVDLWYSLAKTSMRLERVYEIWREKAQRKKRPGAFTLRTMWILGENGKLGAQGPDELRGRYGVVLDGVPTDHPVLRLLGAAVAEYVGAGVPVTVYLNPINVDQLARVGLGDAAGLSVTIERARTAVESAGGHFLDLHALLPDGAFRDPAGHLVLGEPEVVARALARAIAKQPGWPPPGVTR